MIFSIYDVFFAFIVGFSICFFIGCFFSLIKKEAFSDLQLPSLNKYLFSESDVDFFGIREKRLQKIIDTMPYVLTVRDNLGHIIFANQYVASSLHIPLRKICGRHFSDAYNHLNKDTIKQQLQLDRDVMEKGIEYFDSEEVIKDVFGVCRIYQSHRFPFIQDNRQMVLCVAIDVTEQKAKERKMKKLAFFDELTGLPNRTSIYFCLKKEIKRAQRHQLNGAVMFVDLDYFKEVNDGFGHKAGDEILKQVGLRLKNSLREEDVVARLCGDEFIVLLPEIKGDKKEVAAIALAAAEKIRKALEEPFIVNDVRHCISASIGVVIFPDVNSSAGAILDLADSAMYSAKRYGKNSVRLLSN